MIKRSVSIPTFSTAVVHVVAKFKNGATIDKWNKIILNSSQTYDRVAVDFRGQLENFNVNSSYNYHIDIFLE